MNSVTKSVPGSLLEERRIAGRYRVETQLAQGGMGAVFRVLDESTGRRIALKRLGTTDDIAYSVVFLASEQAGYITGMVMNVSGGLYT